MCLYCFLAWKFQNNILKFNSSVPFTLQALVTQIVVVTTKNASVTRMARSPVSALKRKTVLARRTKYAAPMATPT